MNRFQVVATDPEQILNLTMDRQQSLGVGNRFESANLAFFLTGVLVGDLYSVVLVLTSPMLNGREDFAMGGVVAQFQSPREFPALYVTATEFAPTQACPELSYDSAPHI